MNSKQNTAKYPLSLNDVIIAVLFLGATSLFLNNYINAHAMNKSIYNSDQHLAKSDAEN